MFKPPLNSPPYRAVIAALLATTAIVLGPSLAAETDPPTSRIEAVDPTESRAEGAVKMVDVFGPIGNRDAVDAAIRQLERSDHPALAASSAAPPLPTFAEFPQDRLVNQLRTTAAQLDHLANIYENLDRYQQADRVRQMARQLRRQARRERAGTKVDPQASSDDPESPGQP